MPPALGPAQSVLQADPATVAATVTVAPAGSRVFVAAVVVAPVRRLTSPQAGTIGCEPAAGAGVGDGVAAGSGMGAGAGARAGPPLAKRQAKYVLLVPGTVAAPQPKRSYPASSEVRWTDEPMKLRWAMATVPGVVVEPPTQPERRGRSQP